MIPDATLDCMLGRCPTSCPPGGFPPNPTVSPPRHRKTQCKVTQAAKLHNKPPSPHTHTHTHTNTDTKKTNNQTNCPTRLSNNSLLIQHGGKARQIHVRIIAEVLYSLVAANLVVVEVHRTGGEVLQRSEARKGPKTPKALN